ncbi:MAG TPA: hypothetical protein VF065_10490 [Ilumatobacter sp.]
MSGRAEAERALAAADEAMGRSDADGAVAQLSAAIRALTDDPCAAAMVCLRVGSLYGWRLGNLTAARAWFARARRLIEAQPPCIEQGWVAVASMGCDVDDPLELLAAAELALDRARRFGDLNLEMKALADGGLAHVQSGRVAEGMALLDEAMALACGAADDVSTAGQSACSFFTACYFAGDFGRAGSWAELLRRHGVIGPTAGNQIFLSSHCDSVQATLLMELGRWGEAEALLERSRAEFEQVMQMPSWHPDIALADLRIRQGRLSDAEALLIGKDQAMQALLPAARLHVARGDVALARAVVCRGMRVLGEDRLRAVELLTVLVDAELAAGDIAAAAEAADQLQQRLADVTVPALLARAGVARARVLAASGQLDAAIAALEAIVDQLGSAELPWLRATVQLELVRLRDQAGDPAAAADATAVAAALQSFDVVIAPADVALLERLANTSAVTSGASAELTHQGKWWTVDFDGARARLPDSKGLRYVAELVSRPGAERHALDLVDRVEGVDGTIDRRALGDAGAVLDARARTAYRHRIEQLRAEADDALAAGMLETAEAREAELEQLVHQLSAAYGVGGRDRRASSAAERARLNVTRALRTALTRMSEAVPGAGDALDRRIRTGLYCAYEPAPEDVRWIVQC